MGINATEETAILSNAEAIIRVAAPADAHGIAAVHVASWRTTYRGIVPQAYLDGLSVDARALTWQRQLGNAADHTCTYIVEDDGERIIGFAGGGPPRDGNPAYAGELYAIYLLRECQRQGIGRRLVRAVAERLAHEGMRSMLVWVLEDNPSRRFYEALGGVLLPERQYFERGGARLAEVCYGWPDIAVLRAGT
jgi:GNAT superfamily N-acetyltransferase